jgi:hypothetical protein
MIHGFDSHIRTFILLRFNLETYSWVRVPFENLDRVSISHLNRFLVRFPYSNNCIVSIHTLNIVMGSIPSTKNSWVRFPFFKHVMGSIPIFKHFFHVQTHFKVTITTLRVRFPPFKDKQKVKQ